MDKNQIEEELNRMIKRTKDLIDEAYICGYKDGYYECMIHKYKPLEEPKTSKIQVNAQEV